MKRILIPLLFFSTFANAKCVDKTIELDSTLLKIEFDHPWEDSLDDVVVSIKVAEIYKDTKIAEIHLRMENPFILESSLMFQKNEPGSVSSWLHIASNQIDNVEISAIYNNEECFPQQYVIKKMLKYNQALKAQPSAAGTSPTGAASQHSAGGSAP